jgi:hypothetical protein
MPGRARPDATDATLKAAQDPKISQALQEPPALTGTLRPRGTREVQALKLTTSRHPDVCQGVNDGLITIVKTFGNPLSPLGGESFCAHGVKSQCELVVGTRGVHPARDKRKSPGRCDAIGRSSGLTTASGECQ